MLGHTDSLITNIVIPLRTLSHQGKYHGFCQSLKNHIECLYEADSNVMSPKRINTTNRYKSNKIKTKDKTEIVINSQELSLIL